MRHQFVDARNKERKFINTITKTPARRCGRCNNGYYRVNKIEQWTGRTPGKRLGWHKEKLSICTNCQDSRESIRLVEMADVQYSKTTVIRKKV